MTRSLPDDLRFRSALHHVAAVVLAVFAVVLAVFEPWARVGLPPLTDWVMAAVVALYACDRAYRSGVYRARSDAAWWANGSGRREPRWIDNDDPRT